MHMLQPLCIRWAYGSRTDAHPEHKSQELMNALKHKYEIWKCPFKTCWAYACIGIDACTKHSRKDWCKRWANASGTDANAEQMRQELMQMPSKWIRSKIISLYFSPKATYPEKLYGVKIVKIRAIEILH